jgi:carboxylesterase type B
MRMIKLEALALALLMSLLIPVIIASNASPRAETQQGVYIGRQKKVDGTNINYWYGIPFAQQPIGKLRWMPPQALAISNGTNYAFVPHACPQKNSITALFTEACLSLNVYAPANARSLPVYVWIHGGSFTSGAGVEYDAAQFVSTGAEHSAPLVVVTINYRLGLLGFLADEALYDERSGVNGTRTTGNYGILDQMMALDWIKKNIAGFGGNPSQITIGGESAGGISVTILLTSPLVSSGTFQRAIVESGGIWPSDASTLEKAINNSGSVLRNMVKCDTVQCLRSIAVDQILAVQSTIASQNIFGASASPVIDGYVLNDIMENSYARGDFQKVPILIGSNTNETSLFVCPVFNGTASITQVQTFLNTLFNNATIVSQIYSTYGSISSYNNPLAYLDTVFSDSWLHCGSRRIASKFFSHGLPSYLYTYNHLIPAASSCLGVAHAAELPMLFPTLLPFLFPLHKFTKLEQQLSTSMMLYWANFIRTSNPNYSGSTTEWDAYNISSDGDFVLDITSRMREHYYNFTCSRLWDQYAVTSKTRTPLAH